MKFIVPNYSCLQNPWLGGYRPQIPVLSVLNWICWTPPKKIPGYATVWGIGLFWLAVTDCKLNLMCVLDGALQEELAVHRLTGRLCGCHYDRGLMNGGEWPLRTTSKLDRGLCPGVCLPHITCLVWQTDTPLELWLPVTSQSGCHGYHVVLRQCVLCAVRAEAVKTLLNVESRCSGRRVGCDCRRGWAWQFSLLWK